MSFHKMQAAFNIRAMSPTDLLHPLTIPLLPFAAAVLARVIPDQSGRTPWMAAIGAMMLTGLVAAFHDAGDGDWFRMDALASLMAFLVSMLGAVVLRFAARYLNGDPKRSQFLSWMCLTLASVLTMIIANHLLILAAAWMATSLFLHRLLLHHPERSGAVFAARKKAVFSRLAEVLLLAAIWILQEAHGTWKIDELVASIADGNHVGLASAAWLLIICAMLKSAQFPFHSWLPDTMDTPTPVSAFMHAGIINAGGFLILRLAPIFAATPNSLNFLALAGVLTAAFGAIVMLTQAGVKRALAFSTIAQMGFMMVQCGLGAWQLALLHLVAHSVYKAHAFLHAGSTIGL
ncbi:MAG: proton-conducting transporter membrane subunit, partial [Luteolibacter sp.]